MKKLLFLAVTMMLLSVAPKAFAVGQLTTASLTLANALSAQSSDQLFGFKLGTTGTVLSVKFQYCTKPSGTCTAPGTMDVTPAGATAAVTGFTGTWNVTKAGTNQIMVANASQVSLNAGQAVTVNLTGVKNPQVGDCNGGVTTSSSDTCYVRVTTFTDAAATLGNEIDSTIVSDTVVANVTVSARVDPTFTFVVSSVPVGVTNNGITTTQASTYNTLNFGNLTANKPEYAAHKLNVTTNTQNGYTVSVYESARMTGVYASNKIDAFTADWATPATWTIPQGSTPNTNTGWFGANTTDTDVTGWTNGTGVFGGIPLTTNVTVMKASSSDNGSYPVYVTYAIEASVFQPADTYTGAINYNALPTY